MTQPIRVPAVGGQRDVPAPDAIARDYLLLALRLDQRIPGLVDGYFGPADLKAQVDLEQLRPPARLVEDAERLADRLDAEVADPARRAWLRVQLVALATHARALAGEALAYLDLVERCFDAAPVRRGDAFFGAIAAELDAVVPGRGDLGDRLAAWDDRMTVPPDRLPGLLDWLVAVARDRAGRLFGLPAGESLTVSLVTGQPWSGYNWYDGGLRSRVDVNIDLPVRAPALIGLVAHETYPGHHLEHAWHERVLVEQAGRLESSALLINTPECFVSEGLAEVGRRFVAPPETEVDLVAETLERAGLTDPARVTRTEAEIAVRIGRAREGMRATSVDAALLRHVDGRPPDEVLRWLETVGLQAPDRARKSLEFVEDPLWRTYTFVYTEGAGLLERWLDAVPAADRPARFRRLLVEQLTPSGIAAEIAAGPAATAARPVDPPRSG